MSVQKMPTTKIKGKVIALSGWLCLVLILTSCFESRIDLVEGRKIAEKELADPDTVRILSNNNVDVSKLLEPTLEYRDNLLLIDYKDVQQDIWIVIMIHPNGKVELSFTKISE